MLQYEMLVPQKQKKKKQTTLENKFCLNLLILTTFLFQFAWVYQRYWLENQKSKEVDILLSFINLEQNLTASIKDAQTGDSAQLQEESRSKASAGHSRTHGATPQCRWDCLSASNSLSDRAFQGETAGTRHGKRDTSGRTRHRTGTDGRNGGRQSTEVPTPTFVLLNETSHRTLVKIQL